MDTSRLITEIVKTGDSVQRLLPPWTRTALWVMLAIPPIIVVIAIHGLDVDLSTALADRRFVIEQVAALATTLAAATAAFDSTIPGRNRKWYWLPLIPLTMWLATVGAGCVADWRNLGPAGLSLRLDTGCILPMVLIGIVPAVTFVVMLRRGAPLSPRLTLVLAALATAGIVNFSLRFFHIGDVSLMVLVWHFGLVAVLAISAGFVAPRLLGWSRLLARSPVSALP